MRNKKKRILAGALAFLIGCSTLFNSSLVTFAAEEPETQAVETESETSLKTELSEDEIVTAEDITIQAGEKFDIESDFTGLTISPEKVKVTFKEASGTEKQAFDYNKADTYTAVYYVEPYSGRQAYEVTRKIVVTDKEPETNGHSNQEQKQESEESDDDGEGDSQEESETALSDLTPEQVLEKGEALVKKIMAYEDLNVTLTGADLELFRMYQSLLSAGAGRPGMFRAARAAASKLVVRNAKNQTGKWDIPLLDYIYSSKTGNQVHNYVKYIDDDEANGWRLAYCLQISSHFIDETQYIGKEWEANGMYSEIAYAIANGSKVYGDCCNLAYSTGNWIKDYYVTQTVIYCILSDYGYDGHPISSLSAVSGYQDVYDCVQKMYKDVKKNGAGNQDGYGDTPSFEIVAPSSTAMTLSSDGKYYQTGWYKVQVEGELSSKSINLEGAPDGAEIVYKDSSNLKSSFYVRIPVEKAHSIGKEQVTFKVKGTAKFARPFIYMYEALIADAQNVTFLEKKTTNGPKDSEASVTLKLDKSKVQVIKKDDATKVNLAGAVFGIYSDKACTDLITQMPATDANGASEVEFVKTQDTVYLKEISVPQGYKLNTASFNVALVPGKTTSVAVTNQEQKGKITVRKNGEVFTGVTGEAGNLSFVYENSVYAGAKYTVYAAEDIYSQDKTTKVHNAGDVVAQLETGADGSTTTAELYLGKYKVVEEEAPKNLVIGKTEEERTQTVTLAYAGQTVELATGEVSYTNDRPDVTVKVVKKSANDDAALEGAVFGLYAESDITAHNGNVIVGKGMLIEQASSDADGNAVFHSDIPLGFKYSVKESQAPDKYYKSDAVYTFTYEYKNDSTYTYTFEHEFKNEEVRGEIRVKKIDNDSLDFIAQGDAKMVGARYGLYAAEDIQHPNKKSGTVHKTGELVAQGQISSEGTLDFTNLYLGNYIVKEIEPAEGYLLDETEYPVSVAYEGQEVKIVHRDITVRETVKKQAFQLIKISEDGEQTETDLVEGAGFKVFLISSLSGVKEGTLKPANGSTFTSNDFIGYDYSKEETASYYVNGEKVNVPELFTDNTGYLKSPEIPYGDYVVFESTVPENLKNVNPFIVHITEDSREPQVWRVFDDRPLQFYFKIVKKDAQTQETVLNNSASYKIYDVAAEKYVEMIVRYPNKETVSVFQTNEEGYLVTPEQLKCGTYRIEEVQAPDSYVVVGKENSLVSDGVNVPLNEVATGGKYQEAGKAAITITVDSNTVHQVEEETGKFIVVIEQYNDEAVGSLVINKQAEKLKDAEKVENKIVNKMRNGVAALVNTVSGLFTGEDAMEKTSGYEFSYELGGVEGAEFAVYAKETIYTPDGQVDAEGNRIVKYNKNDLVAALVTDAEGKAVVNNLPIGKYVIEEKNAGVNNVLDTVAREFEIKYNGQEIAVDYVTMDWENARQHITIEVLKKDAVTEKALDGVVFGLYAEEDIKNAAGKVVVEKDALIETGTTDSEGKLKFQADLPHGKFYVKELEKKPGYLDNEEIYHFDAGYTDSSKEVIELSCEILNQPTITEFTKTDLTGGQEIEGAKLQILKDGEVIEEWVSEKEPHTVYALEPGEYILHEEQAPTDKGYVRTEDVVFVVEETGEVQKVEMQDDHTKVSISKTDITDGKEVEGAKLQIIDKEGNVVEEWISGEEHLIEYIPVGEYTLHEEQAPTDKGYVRAEDVTFVVEETGEIQKVEMQDDHTKVSISKTDITDGKEVEGAKLQIIDKEGNVIEEWVSGEEHLIEYIPVGEYTLHEEQAPTDKGYVRAEDVTFVVEETGEIQKVEMQDDHTKVSVSKTDITDGEEIQGAKLQIIDKDGKVVEEWITGEEHLIEYIPVGEYTLHEEAAIDGYVVASDVEFTVLETGEIQKVEMKDERAMGVLKIQKTDAETKNPLEGVEFTLFEKESGKEVAKLVTDKDGKAESEKLPIGVYENGKMKEKMVYVLKETKVPEGYEKPEEEWEVVFEYKDDKTPVIEVLKEIQNKKPAAPGTPADAPKTGDDTNWMLPLLGVLAGGICVVYAVLRKRKLKKNTAKKA